MADDSPCQRSWGILATGAIARKFVAGLSNSSTDHVRAVGSRTLERAQIFAKEFGIERAYGSYDALLRDPEVTFVYIATPHPSHVSLIEAAAAAGKHILCEKPLCVTLAEGERAVAACRNAGVALVENVLYRFNSQTKRLLEIIQSGTLGTLHRASVSFSFKCPESNKRLWDPELAGGSILDVGCYPVSMARLLAGSIEGRAYSEPSVIAGSGVLAKTGVDGNASCVLHFGSGLLVDCHCGLFYQGTNDLRIWGSSGNLTVTWPWQPRRGGSSAVLRWTDASGDHCESQGDADGPDQFALAAAAVGEASTNGGTHPNMSWEDSLGQLRVLDAWRSAVGVRYEFDTDTPSCKRARTN